MSGNTTIETEHNNNNELSEFSEIGEASDEHSNNENQMDVQGENDIKKQYQELLCNKEADKKEFEVKLRIANEDKYKAELQLREILAGKNDTLNFNLMKKK